MAGGKVSEGLNFRCSIRRKIVIGVRNIAGYKVTIMRIYIRLSDDPK